MIIIVLRPQTSRTTYTIQTVLSRLTVIGGDDVSGHVIRVARWVVQSVHLFDVIPVVMATSTPTAFSWSPR